MSSFVGRHAEQAQDYNEGDTVWEPFGGLCTASVAAVETGRNAFAAEPDSYFSSLAKQRLAGQFAGDQSPLQM